MCTLIQKRDKCTGRPSTMLYYTNHRRCSELVTKSAAKLQKYTYAFPLAVFTDKTVSCSFKNVGNNIIPNTASMNTRRREGDCPFRRSFYVDTIREFKRYHIKVTYGASW